MSEVSIVLLVLGWLLVSMLAGLTFTLFKVWLDGVFPDNMPQTAAQWLKERIQEAGLKAKISSGPWGFNAFSPLADIIISTSP